jgi:hypothetical protein
MTAMAGVQDAGGPAWLLASRVETKPGRLTVGI